MCPRSRRVVEAAPSRDTLTLAQVYTVDNRLSILPNGAWSESSAKSRSWLGEWPKRSAAPVLYGGTALRTSAEDDQPQQQETDGGGERHRAELGQVVRQDGTLADG